MRAADSGDEEAPCGIAAFPADKILTILPFFFAAICGALAMDALALQTEANSAISDAPQPSMGGKK
jgi:hypothetical protein